MKAMAIIGAGFGDEGKGRWTDLAAHRAAQRRQSVWVIRYNGGAQAGHTVQLPDGRRHVFHHVSSGSFAGATTYLGPGFAVHPMLLLPELDALDRWGVSPVLRVAPEAPLTTPYDIMINQALEQTRGGARHGSCGVGFGETIQRHETPGWALTVADLSSPKAFRERLEAIRQIYVPQRLAALGLPLATLDPWRLHDGVLERFLADGQAAQSRWVLTRPEEVQDVEVAIFEGAQGLRLDMDLGLFPHVTRSYTGLPAILPLARRIGVDELAITYATRAYLTRHGAGPLEEELPGPPTARVEDATNVPNPHQGTLRFAHLDVAALNHYIQADLRRGDGQGVRLTHGLAVSCLDQMGPVTTLREGACATSDLPDLLQKACGGAWMGTSWGPDRSQARMAIWD